MDFSHIRVLVLDGHGRQVLPTLKGLHDCGCHITTLNYSKLDLGYTSRFPNKRILAKGIENNVDAISREIEREIMTGKYDVLIPLSDVTTQIVSRNLEKYTKYVRTFVPDYSTFMKAYDKQQTMEICQKIGVPNTLTKSDTRSIKNFVDEVGFPIVMKPRSAYGSLGFRCIKTQEELNALLCEFELERYVIQEYVNQSGKQYNVHLFMDNNDELTIAIPTEKCRWYPVDGGSSCFCRIIERDDLVKQCETLLKSMHWRGYCEIELIEDPVTKIAKVIEINGRTSASIKICQLFGVNVAQNMLELAYGEKVTNQILPFRDIRMRCIHTDFLWLLKSPKRWKTEPAWFNNIHTHDQIFSISDPWPFFTFTIQSIKKYKSEMERRSR